MLADIPPLLRDLLRDSLQRHPGLWIEDDDGRGGLAAVVRRTRPDAVILAAATPLPVAEIEATLFEHPRTRILVIANRGATAELHEMRPTRRDVADVTPAGLGRAIVERVTRDRVREA